MVRGASILGLALACCLAALHTESAQRAVTAKAGATAYRVAGVVVDATTGTPVAGAELSISETTLEMEVTADGEGRFVFAGVEPGKHPVYASAPGYVTEAYNEHWGYSTAIAVGNGLDSEHIVFRLHRQAVILGNVTDERGEAVRAAQVMLFREERGGGESAIRMLSQTQTNDLGAYRFAHLLAGKYYLAVTARPWYAQTGLKNQAWIKRADGESFGMEHPWRGPDPKLDVVYPTTFYPGVTDQQSAGELVVSAGDTQEADVRLQAVPAMHVRLTNVLTGQPDGPGVGIGANQKIFDSYSAGLPVVSAQVAPGVYEVAGLPAGDVMLTLNENRNGEWESQMIHANVSEGETLDASGTGATASVTGRVITADGSGTGMQGDVILSGKEQQTVSRKLQKDGTFSFTGVEADTYEVSVNRGVEGEYVERVTATGAKASGQELKIEGASEVQLVVWMGRGLGQISGVVKKEGKQMGGVMVLLVPETGGNPERETRMDQSDSDGTFTLAAIFPGKYVLMAIEDGWDLEWADEGVLKPYREKGEKIQVTAGEMKKVTVEVEKKEEVKK